MMIRCRISPLNIHDIQLYVVTSLRALPSPVFPVPSPNPIYLLSQLSEHRICITQSAFLYTRVGVEFECKRDWCRRVGWQGLLGSGPDVCWGAGSGYRSGRGEVRGDAGNEGRVWKLKVLQYTARSVWPIV
jgi:hypothetical protein